MNQMISNTPRTITTSPGATIGRDGESLPRKAHIEPPRELGEVVAGIHGLARTVQAETGRYVVYSEHMHEGCLAVTVSVQVGDGEFAWFRGSENPLAGHETTIEQVRDDLCAYLIEHRRKAA
jgi:hypothetical protein